MAVVGMGTHVLDVGLAVGTGVGGCVNTFVVGAAVGLFVDFSLKSNTKAGVGAKLGKSDAAMPFTILTIPSTHVSAVLSDGF